MKYYETLYIVHPALESGRLKDIILSVEGMYTNMSTKILNTDVWGKKKLAYAIDKQKYGTYILCQYSLGGEYIKELSQEFELNPNILRYLITKIENSDIKEGSNQLEIKEYRDYIGNKSWEFLDWMGYDLKNHTLVFTGLWVQQFPKDGGGYLNAHIHPNNHVSGFFYLKVDKDSSFPVFHDPRPAALSSALPQKNEETITYASESVH